MTPREELEQWIEERQRSAHYNGLSPEACGRVLKALKRAVLLINSDCVPTADDTLAAILADLKGTEGKTKCP